MSLPPEEAFEDALTVELTRQYLTKLDRAFFSASSPEVTGDEARAVMAKVRAEQHLDNTLDKLVGVLANLVPADGQKIVMSRDHFEHTRWRYKRPPAYSGGRQPKLYGFPIEIDATAVVPRLDPPTASAYMSMLVEVAKSFGPPRERMRVRMSTADHEALKVGTLDLDDETKALLKLHATIPEGIPAHMRPLFGLDIVLDDECPRPVIEPVPPPKDRDSEGGKS